MGYSVNVSSSGSSSSDEEILEKIPDPIVFWALCKKRGWVGRPPKPFLSLNSRGSWEVRATVMGRRYRKRFGNREEADDYLDRLTGQKPPPMRPTWLSSAQLRVSEAAVTMIEGRPLLDVIRAGLDAMKSSSPMVWNDAWADYERLRGSRASKARLTNVKSAFFAFAKHVGRDTLGTPSREEVEAWLEKSLPKDCKPATYNHRANDLSTILAWLHKRGVIAVNPCASVDRQKVERELPTTLPPAACEAMLRDLEKGDHVWVAWVAVLLFTGLRPSMRDGEIRRMSNDLSAGKAVVAPGGLVVFKGKNKRPRIIPWEASGPLREWLEAYPLHPLPKPARAERDWRKLKEKHGLTQDVLRHTAGSCMLHSGLWSTAEVVAHLGNSGEAFFKHYLGLWSRAMTQQVYAILPHGRTLACVLPNNSAEKRAG